MAHFTFEDREVFYEEQGSGPAVVFLHAFPLSSAMWARQLASTSANFRAIRLDFPGFGQSKPAAAPVSIELYARATLALLDKLEVRAAAFVGLSMGGYVALAIHARAPDRVAALILCDTRANGDSPEARQGRETTAQAVETQGVQILAERMLPNLLSKGASEQVRRQVEQMISQSSAQGAAAALRAMALRSDHTRVLPRISCPTLVLCGTQDILTPPAESKGLANALRQSSYVELEGAGHLSNLEQPQAFDQALLKFLLEGVLPA